MTKKTRLIILLVCILLFIFIAPSIVLYSLGYKIDFEQKKIVATGGIYLKIWPQPAEVFVNSKLKGKTKMFSDDIFVQNLLSKQHNILIKKDGYFPYEKIIDVKENEVAKLEHIILFKENIPFESLKDGQASPFKKQEPADEESPSVSKNAVAFKNTDSGIIWLSKDGFLYISNISGQNSEKINSAPLSINKKNSYKIETVFQNIFVFENDNLLLFNQKTKELQNFYNPIKNIIVSPDGQKILFYNDYEILFSYVWQLQNSENPEKIFLNRFSEKISQGVWLNNDYIIFVINGKIKISEIDNKNNLNIITLPEKIGPSDESSLKIYFSHQDKKLYILLNDTVLVSEKIAP